MANGTKSVRRNGRPNATGRRNADARHVRLYHWLLASSAWHSLDPNARALLIVLYGYYNGQNNGELFLSVRSAAAALNIGKDSAARAFKKLNETGFIRPRQKGAFSWKAKVATSWVLTEFPLNEALGTKDFMRWRQGKIGNTVALQVQTVAPEGQSSNY